MMRVILAFLIATVACAILSTISVAFGIRDLPLSMVPWVLVFSVCFLGMAVGLFLLLLFGFVVDVLSGLSIGLHIGLFFVVWFLFSSFLAWVGKPRWEVIGGFVFLASCMYRILLWGMMSVVSLHRGSVEWTAFAIAPFFDALLGGGFMYVVHQLFAYLGLMESMDDVTQRLSARRNLNISR